MKRKTVLALLATMALTTGATGTAFAANFTDVAKGTPVETYVTDVTDKNLMDGETDTEFGVAEGTTRSDLVQALYRLNINLPVTGSHDFTDIDGREDAAAIEWADDVGLFDDLKDDFFTDNKFEPDKDLTREEAAQILYTFAEKVDKMDVTEGVGSLKGYTDSEDATVSYADAMKWALGNKIFTGDDLNTDETENAIRPTTVISKAETAQALSVYMTLRGNTQEEIKQATNKITNNTVKPESKPVATVQTPSKNETTETETEDVQQAPVKEDQTTTTQPEAKPDDQTPSGDVETPETPNTGNEDQNQGGAETPDVPEQGGDVETPDVPEQGGDVETPENPDGGDATDPSVPTTPEKPENPDQGGTETPDEPEAHTHTWGDAYYVKDADAVYSEPEWIVTKPAEYEQIKVVDTPAWDEDITEIQDICFSCEDKGIHTQFINGEVVGTGESLQNHVTAHMLAGESGAYGSREVVVDTIHHDEVFHYENGALISPEEGHWTESVLISPEKGHWEHACADCGTVENCEKPEA